MGIKHLSPAVSLQSTVEVCTRLPRVMSHLRRAINYDTITNNKQRKDCLMTRGKEQKSNDRH
jgi:hypothetical protein